MQNKLTSTYMRVIEGQRHVVVQVEQVLFDQRVMGAAVHEHIGTTNVDIHVLVAAAARAAASSVAGAIAAARAHVHVATVAVVQRVHVRLQVLQIVVLASLPAITAATATSLLQHIIALADMLILMRLGGGGGQTIEMTVHVRVGVRHGGRRRNMIVERGMLMRMMGVRLMGQVIRWRKVRRLKVGRRWRVRRETCGRAGAKRAGRARAECGDRGETTRAMTAHQIATVL